MAKKEVGRPKKYTPEFFTGQITNKAQEIVDKGGGDATLCVALGTNRDTLWRYRKDYPEVAQAYETFQLMKEARLEQLLDKSIYDKHVNATPVIYSLKNTSPKYWNGDKDPERATINIQNMNVLNMSEVNQKLAHLMEKYSATNIEELKQKVLTNE